MGGVSVHVCVSACVCVHVCVHVCACMCVFIYIYGNYVFMCVVCVHARPLVCRVSHCSSIWCLQVDLNSACVYTEYACVGVGGQGSQYTQKSYTLTFWCWETLKSHNVWCFV